MDSAGGPAAVAVSKQLLAEGHTFDFFEAVRLIERIAVESARQAGVAPERSPVRVGEDGPIQREAARFSAAPGLSFAAASIRSVRPLAGTADDAEAADDSAAKPMAPMELLVNFMGLTGPNGAMPHHYSAQVIAERDGGMRAFFDVFNHRVISLFYRAWVKYRFPIAYERVEVTSASKTAEAFPLDVFNGALHCLAGFGTGGLAGRTVVDETVLFYAGIFAHHPRCAASLEQMLSEYLHVPSVLSMFEPQWLSLAPGDRSRLPGPGDGESANCRIGSSLVLGDRVRDVQSKFRVQLGPLTYAQYCKFTPEGDGLRPVCELTRLYVGQEFDFDVRPVLRADSVPSLRFGDTAGPPPRLGRNIWVNTRPPEKDFDGAGFYWETE